MLREAFIRKNRKYIGVLPIGGYPPPPPLARIGNFRFFPWAFLVIFFIILKSSPRHEKDSVWYGKPNFGQINWCFSYESFP